MKLYVAESKLEISCNIIDDFRRQYELALDKIYDLQGEIDELVDECCQQKQTILTLNSKLSQIQKKYKTQSQLHFKITKIEKFSKCCIIISFSFMDSFIVLMTLREGKR
jgi:predicted RNase H-like nuclease (RuvC/YqgF family)